MTYGTVEEIDTPMKLKEQMKWDHVHEHTHSQLGSQRQFGPQGETSK